MRILYLGLITSITIASAICVYCFYVLTTAFFSEFDYNFDLDTRSPSILPMSAILQWYDPYFNKTSRSIGRYAAFGPIININYPEEYLEPTVARTSVREQKPKEGFRGTDSLSEYIDSILACFSFGRFNYLGGDNDMSFYGTSDEQDEDVDNNGRNYNENENENDSNSSPIEFFEGDLVHIKDNACDLDSLDQALLSLPEFDSVTKQFKNNNTIVLNERGGCAFYDKILNFQKKGAKAIIIGNDQLKRGLLTMFSKNVPEKITVPSVFITKETMNELNKLIYANSTRSLKLVIFTGQTPSPLLDALLTLVFSPPIALLILYIVIKLRRSHKKNLEKAPRNVVKTLPVFVYNAEYLIPISEFENRKEFYLGVSDKASDVNRSLSILKAQAQANSANGSPKNSNVNWLVTSLFRNHFSKQAVDDKSLSSVKDSFSNASINSTSEILPRTVQRHLSIEELNQYQINQCSICLNNFRKLKSKVILLPCNHYFHYKCCLNWLCNYRKVCPICKHDITKKPINSFRRSISSSSRSVSAFFARSTVMNIFGNTNGASNHRNSNHDALAFSNTNRQNLMIDRGTSPGVNGQSMIAGTSNSLNYNSIDNSYDSNPLYPRELVISESDVLIEDSSDEVSSNDVMLDSPYSSREHDIEHSHFGVSYENRHSFANNNIVQSERLPLLPDNEELDSYLVDEEQSIENATFY